MNKYIDQAVSTFKKQPAKFIVFALIVIFLFSAVSIKVLGDNKGFAIDGAKIIEVKPGMSTSEIAEMLNKEQLVKSPDAFSMEARVKGLASKLQAGMYRINGGMSNSEIVDVLASGSIMKVQFTVPEGYNVIKTARKIEAEGLGKADKFIEAAKNYAPYSYMENDNANVIFKAEGFIYPATYDFPVGTSEEKMLEIMVAQFNQEMENAGILSQIKENNLNLRDVVNLAAMVELEAVYADEQPKIAGVFLKRLEIGMPIQSDTTIQYILGVQKEVITFDDTKIQNPYNTYQIMGLPPGPIASPGLNAIKAVLHPEMTDYLYFVAEKNGYHRFSVTYDEHLKAIDEIHGES